MNTSAKKAVWEPGRKAKVTTCTSGHGFEIGEIVTIVEREDNSWECVNDKGIYWFLDEHEAELIDKTMAHEKTAVAYLLDIYVQNDGHISTAQWAEAIRMNQQQIEEAYEDGGINGIKLSFSKEFIGTLPSDYFTQKYGK